MSLFPKSRSAAIAMLLVAAVALVAVACGEEDSPETNGSNLLGVEETSGADNQVSGGFGFGGAATVSPSALPPQAPAPTSVPGNPGAFFDQRNDSDNSAGDAGLPDLPLEPLEQPQAQVGQQRIIVRNVAMEIETPNVSSTIDEIGRLSTRNGGWVVSTQNVEVHRGSIDIRVPAERLDDTLASLREIAANVTSEVSSSQDFTEEFTDTTSRIQTLQDTVDALRALFDRAVEIEDALEIQREITRIQSDIEAKQARINFLSESAAYSLVRVAVLALPQEMVITAGDDVLAAVGRPVRFRAEFTPPEGIEDFQIEWDFGDGSGKQVISGVAPVDENGRLISAPVAHLYGDDTDSPYIVRVEVKGFGESGAAEGDDVMVVTVNRVPPIEVFAGESQTVEAGDTVKLRGSFTRPEGVENLEYTWDFGDGSAPMTIPADTGATIAEIEHRFANSRPQSYNVVLTVRGVTPSGLTEGVGQIQVRVTEPESFAPGDTSKSAFDVLTSVGTGAVTAIIWIGILSPIWLLVGGVAFVLYRNSKPRKPVTRRATPDATENE